MNTPGVPCIFDPQGRAGICGDWLTGSSIEAAVLSGMSLGDHVNAATVALCTLLSISYVCSQEIGLSYTGSVSLMLSSWFKFVDADRGLLRERWRTTGGVCTRFG
jgi:hypothetical protein